MIANRWYCIAQTGVFNSGCSIEVSFGEYYVQFYASVRLGASSINIARCKLPSTISLSVRLRQLGSQWSVDLISTSDIDANITVSDSPYWSAVNTIAGAGEVVVFIKDISKDFNTETEGSGGGLDTDELKQFLDKNGYSDLLKWWAWDSDNKAVRTTFPVILDSYLTFGGVSTDEPALPSGLQKVAIKFEDGKGPYESDEWGNITLPAYPTELKNPYALVINGQTYDGSKRVVINIEGGGGVADSVAWENVTGRPTKLSELGNDLGLDNIYVKIAGNNEITGVHTFKNGLKIGDAELVWDDTNKALRIIGSTYVTENFSFGGYNTSDEPTTVVASLADLLDVSLTSPSDGQSLVYNEVTGKWENKVVSGGGVADSVAWSNVTNKPTTLVGYGITDAYTTTSIDSKLSGYLPKSGGTLTNSLAVSAGTISSTRTSTRRSVFYKNASTSADNGTYIVDISDSGDAILKLTYNDLTWKGNTLYHTGNFNPANYLPLSGGTFNFPRLSPGATVSPRIGKFDRAAGSLVFQLGTSNIFDIVDSDWKNAMLRVASNEFSYYGNNIIHSGNIGSYNAGSATKLQTAKNIYGNLFDGTQDLSKARPFLKSSSASESIVRSTESITIGTSTEARVGYSSGIGFNALAGYGGYEAHTHAWIGLKGYVSGAGAETYNLVFATNDNTTTGASPTERMRITPSGNVLIGTTTDNGAKLQVNGKIKAPAINAGSFYIGATYDGNSEGAYDCIERDIYGATIYMQYFNSGGISMCNGGGAVTMGGNLTVTGDIAFGSDARLKDNITTVTAEESINILRQLRPTTWNWKKSGNRSYGLIAQEVLPIVPAMVTNGEHLHLQYNHLHAFEIGSIQHIDTEVETLKKDLKVANARIEVLENKLKQYRRA